jgi:hypothetical protein
MIIRLIFKLIICRLFIALTIRFNPVNALFLRLRIKLIFCLKIIALTEIGIPPDGMNLRLEINFFQLVLDFVA